LRRRGRPGCGSGPTGLFIVTVGGTVTLPLQAAAHLIPTDDQMATGEGQVDLSSLDQLEKGDWKKGTA